MMGSKLQSRKLLTQNRNLLLHGIIPVGTVDDAILRGKGRLVSCQSFCGAGGVPLTRRHDECRQELLKTVARRTYGQIQRMVSRVEVMVSGVDDEGERGGVGSVEDQAEG